MATSTTHDVSQYSKWVSNIGRNARITNPEGAELTAIRTFLKEIWDVTNETGTRPWLATMFNEKTGINYFAGQTLKPGDVDNEPAHAVVEMLVAVGRNLKNPPMTTAEGNLVDTLMTATGNRKTGESLFFGGTI